MWLHNPPRYLKKPRNVWRLARYRPTLVVTGAYHAATVPQWLPCGGLRDHPLWRPRSVPRTRAAREPPPPRAVFTSNPLRGLDWLLDLWARAIAPAVPAAELHIYAGPAVYGASASAERRGGWRRCCARADALAAHGVRRFAPVGREALPTCSPGARVMLYRGDPGETFCLALAEAQAMGVPAVVEPLGCVAERVIDGVTGRVAQDDEPSSTQRSRRCATTSCGGAGISPRSSASGDSAGTTVARPLRGADADDPAAAAGDRRGAAWRRGDFLRPAGARRCSGRARRSAC